MSDDSEVQNTQQRFAIIVPEPKTRLNFGQPDEWITGPFGYTGVSIQADDHIFLDAGGDALQQTAGAHHLQASDELSAFAGGGMSLSSDGATHMSASDTVTIVAGAGQGDVGVSDHGDDPGLPSYNNLELHYRVDEIQTNLFEFFHGRRVRHTNPAPWPLVPFGPLKEKTFVFDNSDAQEAETELELKGFIYSVEKSMLELYPSATQISKALKGPVVLPAPPRPPGPPVGPAPAVPPLVPAEEPLDRTGHPLALIEELRAAVLGKHYPGALKYGYSDYQARFDPYGMSDPADETKPVGKMLCQLGNLLSVLNRFVDVISRYGLLISDNFIWKRATQAAGCIGAFHELASSLAVVANPFVQVVFNPSFLSDFFVAQAEGVRDDVVDPTLDVGEKGGAVGTDADPGGQAEIVSERGPFELRDGGTFTIESDVGPAVTSVPAIGGPGRRAKVTTAAFTAPLASQEAAVVTVTLDGAVFECLVVDSITTRDELFSLLSGASCLVSGDALSTVATLSKLDPVGIEIESQVDLVFGSGETATVELAIGNVLPVDLDVAAALGLSSISDTVHAANVIDITAVTVAEVLELLGDVPGCDVSVTGGRMVFTSQTEGTGSKVEGTAGACEMAATLGLVALDEIELNPADYITTTVDNLDALLGSLSGWAEAMVNLPSECDRLTEPLIEGVKSVVDSVQAANDFVENVVEVVDGLEGDPSAIGLFASDGITLGTPDRIIGSGSKGIVFIADGGSPTADHEKFVATEDTVSRLLEWDPIHDLITKNDPDETEPPSLGFRVLSDSVVDMTARSAVQVMALGRAKMDGKHVGVGVARVAASHAAELVGHKKVVISARTETATESTKMGRVEIAAQTIAIGGVNHLEQDLSDFKAPAAAPVTPGRPGVGGAPPIPPRVGPAPPADTEPRFGIQPLTLSKQHFGGQGGVDDKTGKWTEEVPRLGAHAWTSKLLDEHPQTDNVIVHANNQTTILVGNYVVHVAADTGIVVGQRTKNAEALTTELDLAKPHFQVDDTDVWLRVAESGAHMHIADKLVEIFAQDSGNQIVVDDSKITMKVGGQEMVLDKQTIKVKQGGNSLELGAGGVVVKGSVIKWG